MSEGTFADVVDHFICYQFYCLLPQALLTLAVFLMEIHIFNDNGADPDQLTFLEAN